MHQYSNQYVPLLFSFIYAIRFISKSFNFLIEFIARTTGRHGNWGNHPHCQWYAHENGAQGLGRIVKSLANICIRIIDTFIIQAGNFVELSRLGLATGF